MKYIITIIGLTLFIFLLLSQNARLEAFNAQQCAVYGYEADCKTKLK